MVSSRPAPLTSTLPPSSTMSGLPEIDAGTRSGIALPAASSRRWLSYFAQPLKRHLTAATSPAGFLHEQRREIARPDAIGWHADRTRSASHWTPHLFEHVAGVLLDVVVLQQDAHALHLRELAHDFAVDPRNRFEAPGPVVLRCAARRSRWLRAAPTRRACGSPSARVSEFRSHDRNRLVMAP